MVFKGVPDMLKELDDWKKLHDFYKGNDFLTKDMADFLKISPRTIQRWIRGKTNPSAKELDLIKRYLSERTAKPAE